MQVVYNLDTVDAKLIFSYAFKIVGTGVNASKDERF